MARRPTAVESSHWGPGTWLCYSELGPDSAWCALSQILGSALLKAGCQLAVACAGARSGWIQIRVDLADNIRVGYVRWACCAASPRSQRAREA